MKTVAAIALTLIGSAVGSESPRPVSNQSLDVTAHAKISAALEPKSAALHFGIPQARFSIPETLKDEPRTQIEGFDFYSRRLPEGTETMISGLVIRAFQRLDLHKAHPGLAKLCLFHPDLAVVSTKGSRSAAVLLCLTCSEWKAHVGGTTYSADVDPVLAESLKLVHAFAFGHFARANKAPEPTPGSVTPRATESKSK